MEKKIKCELYNDNFQNYKSYNIPAKAQLVITDIPYNIGNNAYGSNPSWYVGGCMGMLMMALCVIAKKGDDGK